MPLLYPVGMFCIVVTYWIDKILFLRIFKTPPVYDNTMAIRAIKIMKVSVILHSFMTFFIYSNDAFTSHSD